MIVKFTKEEKSLILNLLERYHNINVEYDTYMKQAKEIKKRIDDIKIRLNEARKEEDELIASLKEKYGNFGLMDIHETLQRDEQ